MSMLVKRPTLATTKNCIMILKEAHACSYQGLNRDRIAMVLTMLTDDKGWMETACKKEMEK